MENFKIISKRNPVTFLDVKKVYKNAKSVPINKYFICDVNTSELYTRTPHLEKTGESLPSLVESDLFYDAELKRIRLKTDEEKTEESDVIINNSFHNKNYKVTSSLPWIFENFPVIYVLCKENSTIIDASTPDGEDNLKSHVFLDKISAPMQLVIDNYPNNISKEKNPAKLTEIDEIEITMTKEMAIFKENYPEEVATILAKSENN